MSQKPTDFFFSLVDFFAILMPGALLGFLLLDFGTPLFGTVFPPLQSPAAEWIAFAVAAYVLGHLLHHVGTILDRGYDKLYVKKWKRLKGEEKLLTKARMIMNEELGNDTDMTSTYSWAGSFVRISNSAAAKELERAGADSKFFRSLALVAIVAITIFISRSLVVATLGALLLLAFSVWRFCDLRWKASQLTYEYFIMLNKHPQKSKDSEGGGGNSD